MSAESGLKTFREMGGLWETHDVYEVASPTGWVTSIPTLLLPCYNETPVRVHRYIRVGLGVARIRVDPEL